MQHKFSYITRILTTIALIGFIICYLTKADKTLTTTFLF